RPSAKASISPSTRSAPTTCDPPRARASVSARAQNYGLGTYPAMPRPLRGSSASWSPFLFSDEPEQQGDRQTLVCLVTEPVSPNALDPLFFRPIARVPMDEREKIEHQLELATRVAEIIKDESTVQRLRNFADQLRHKLHRMMRRPKVRTRAYELWEEAGRPSGRDVDFWLEAERQVSERLDV